MKAAAIQKQLQMRPPFHRQMKDTTGGSLAAYPTLKKIILHYFKVVANNLFYLQTWSELLAPLVNMIKEGSENKPAL